MSKKVGRDQKPKLVVIVGETHFKLKKESDLGKKLLSHFDFKGLEGVQFGKYWLSGLTFLPVMVVVAIGALILQLKGSTIHDATTDPELENTPKDQDAPNTQDRVGTADSSKSPANRTGNDVLSEAQKKKILSRMERLREGDLEDGPVTLPLEQGHRPTLRENLAFLRLGSIIPVALSGFIYNRWISSLGKKYPHKIKVPITIDELVKMAHIPGEKSKQAYQAYIDKINNRYTWRSADGTQLIPPRKKQAVEWIHFLFLAYGIYATTADIIDLVEEQWGNRNPWEVGEAALSTVLHPGFTLLLPGKNTKVEKALSTASEVAFYGSVGAAVVTKKPSVGLLFLGGLHGILHERNKTMAKNINMGLMKYSRFDKLLVIVGMNHVSGLRRLLEKDGFKQEALPALQ